MAVWLKLQNLDEDARTKLQEIYGKYNFPLEVRGLFAEWIENQTWDGYDQTQTDHQNEVEQLTKELIRKLEEKSQQPANDLITQMRFKELSKHVKDSYQEYPWNLVFTLKGILAAEQELIHSVEKPTSGLSPIMDIEEPESPAIANIGEFIENLKVVTQRTDTELKNYKQQQEDFVISYQDICKVDYEINQAQELPEKQREQKMAFLNREKTNVEKRLRDKALKILGERESIFTKLEQLSQDVEQVSNKVYQELFVWRMNQQKSLSGGEKPGQLDELQTWFELLTDTLWSLYQLCTQYKLLFDALPIIKNGDEEENVKKLLEKSVSNLTTLIHRSFIVDKQPPQVLKTQTKFQASVRLLVGAKLNLQMNCPEVVATILSEKQAKEIVQGAKVEETGNCGEILNNRSVMEYNQQMHALHADFKNLSLKKIKRQDRKGQESVLEAKSCLVFSANITIGGDKLPVLCMSVPVVVVVHGNQGPNSEATIFWDNFFSSPDREPFEVPEDVPWDQMSYALNARWSMTAECSLACSHLDYLGAKLFVSTDHSSADRKVVSWHSFNKEPLKGRNFTFWEWFHAGMELVKRHLKDHWSDGYLEFMSRDEAHQRLSTKPPGTFLIRFSDGEIGGVSIAWVTESGEIWHLQPWTAKDFSIRSLADRIFDLEQLTSLYPCTPKTDAFGKFKSQDVYAGQRDPHGYVQSLIMTRINFNNSSMQNEGSRMDPLPSPSSNELREDIPMPNMMNFTSESLSNPDAGSNFDMSWVDRELDSIMDGTGHDTPTVEEFVRSLDIL